MNKTNILLITSDQQHFNTIGAFNKEIKTPNLDRLVKEGMTFKRAYCPNPTCTPTRASLITGQYPSQHGAYSLGTKLLEDRRTVGDVFLENGYATALIGKAHFQPLRSSDEYSSLESYPILQDLDFWKNYSDVFYGFEHIELARNHTNEAHVGQHYAIWLEEKGVKNWKDYFLAPTGNMPKEQKYVWDIDEEYHYDAWIAERTNAMMDKYKAEDKPFFLWASFFDPHPDYFAPKPYCDMYDENELEERCVVEHEHDNNPTHFKLTQEENPDFSDYNETGFGIHGMHSHVKKSKTAKKDRAVYYGMITLMDKYIGKILDKLDDLGLADNTLVVFTTDHGHFIGEHGLYAKGPFHYEDMIKVPFIAKWPNKIPKNVQSDALLSLVDVAPTFLEACDIDVPIEMTGISQIGLMANNEKAKRDCILVENRHEPTKIHLKTYVDDRYKLTFYYNRDEGELFDLKEDPNELNNRWNDKEFEALKNDLIKKMLNAELGKEVLPMPRIAGA